MYWGMKYIDSPDPKLAAFLKQRLTLTAQDDARSVRTFYDETLGGLYIPKHFSSKFPVKSSSSPKMSQEYKFKGTLWKNQERAVKDALAEGHGNIVMPCGKGKTVVGAYLICRYGLKALVLVHTEFLRDQWLETFAKFTDIPEDRIGFIRGGGDTSWHGKDVVIGMIQSVMKKTSVPEFEGKYFGITLADEVHRQAAPVFSQAIRHYDSKHRFGFSATPDRRDGMSVVFRWHFGNDVHRDLKVTDSVTVVRVNSSFTAPVKRFYRWGTSEINFGKLTSAIANDDLRNVLLIEIIERMYREDRTILVLSERLKQLHLFKDRLLASGLISEEEVGFFVGATGKTERDRIKEEAKIILATAQLAAEGLDVPRLDTLVFGTPRSGKNWLKQACGRILREVPGKRTPLVVDTVDQMTFLKNLSSVRKRFYSTMKWEILDV